MMNTHKDGGICLEKKKESDSKLSRFCIQLEKEIEQTETSITTLEAQIAAPETASDYEALSAFCAQLEQTKQQLDSLVSEWAELSELMESIE